MMRIESRTGPGDSAILSRQFDQFMCSACATWTGRVSCTCQTPPVVKSTLRYAGCYPVVYCETCSVLIPVPMCRDCYCAVQDGKCECGDVSIAPDGQIIMTPMPPTPVKVAP